MPSGVMANLLWTKVLAPPATEVVIERWGHAVAYEDGAGAANAGVQYLTVEGDRGRLDADTVRAALRPAGFPYVTVSMIAAEETTNRGGGAIHGLERLRGLRALADERGASLHVDGARIWHAIVATDASAEDYGAIATGMNFCLSKGLGAPIGSVLVGDADAIAEARAWRRRFGGAMRQVGVLAAAGLHALEHHVDRLAEDHDQRPPDRRASCRSRPRVGRPCSGGHQHPVRAHRRPARPGRGGPGGGAGRAMLGGRLRQHPAGHPPRRQPRRLPDRGGRPGGPPHGRRVILGRS